ncbi:lactonase family protein [Flagellimonas marina]|uniref:Lactonase family protein n=1 Tax=Flagellimonas marina TaxID=1775168 RepID=A0ABV8PPV0_9FLAO
MNRLKLLCIALVSIGAVFQSMLGQDTKTFLFVGSYTDGQKATGISVYQFDYMSGGLTLLEEVGNLVNLSFLTLSRNGKYLYAATEARLETPGSVSAFEIDPSNGSLLFLNKQTTKGKNPVHVVVDNDGKYLVSSNYTDPMIGLFQCEADGSLTPILQSIKFEGSSVVAPNQNSAHLHSSNFGPEGKYILSPDLGADKIRVFSLDQEKGKLMVEENLTLDTQKGAGPRHLTFHPNGNFAYCVEELSGTVTAYGYNDGKLTLIDTYFSYSKKSEGIYHGADIHISPDGLFAYVSNRLKEENTIAIFSIDPHTGELTLQGHQSTLGEVPRNFVIDPTGKFLLVANLTSGTIVVFRRDEKTGLLSYTGNKIEVGLPACLKMKTFKD